MVDVGWLCFGGCGMNCIGIIVLLKRARFWESISFWIMSNSWVSWVYDGWEYPLVLILFLMEKYHIKWGEYIQDTKDALWLCSHHNFKILSWWKARNICAEKKIPVVYAAVSCTYFIVFYYHCVWLAFYTKSPIKW